MSAEIHRLHSRKVLPGTGAWPHDDSPPIVIVKVDDGSLDALRGIRNALYADLAMFAVAMVAMIAAMWR